MKISFLKCLFLSSVLMGLATNTIYATEAKTLLTDKEMKVAMLDLSGQGFVIPDIKKTSKSSKLPVLKYSKNCMDWNLAQINQKSKQFDPIINKYAKQYRVDRHLVKSVITAESCFRVKALSSAGAQGLMQLIPATAERFGVKNSYKPEQNIRGGVKYLKFLLDRYKGDFVKTVAAYNAGEGKVDRYKGVPPYKETKQYVKNVLSVYALLNPGNKTKKAVYTPPKLGQKPGRHGWQYNRKLAPHLFKQN